MLAGTFVTRPRTTTGTGRAGQGGGEWPVATYGTGRTGRAGRDRQGHATYGAAPESVAIGRPAAAQSCMPPATLIASQPALTSAAVAWAERCPDRQIT